MGNIAAVDMGIVIIRCVIFDMKNQIFPFKIQKEQTAVDPRSQQYFVSDLSFYSKEHGGTFHFFQFNILHAKEFLESAEFQHILSFMDKQYGIQKKTATQFIENLELRKNILEFKESEAFVHHSVIRDYNQMPILSTGGYNDHFLSFISHVFNTKIVKLRDYLPFVINAIDYLNKVTNDCFFQLEGKATDKINYCGKLNFQKKPKQNFFSEKEELYPYLLVNLRSGATFTRVDSKTSCKRVCGTSIGSSFFWGILRLLGEFSDPSLAVQAGVAGDSSNIDISVGDIYGGDYSSIGLPAQMIASTFGKVKDMSPDQLKNLNRNDISRSLITMVAMNTLLFSNMTAQLENLKRVVWMGVHIDILEYMQMSQQAFDLISKGDIKLMYPTYHSFLGSLGLLLSHGNLSDHQID